MRESFSWCNLSGMNTKDMSELSLARFLVRLTEVHTEDGPDKQAEIIAAISKAFELVTPDLSPQNRASIFHNDGE